MDIVDVKSSLQIQPTWYQGIKGIKDTYKYSFMCQPDITLLRN
jgi:hypothetical protein